MIQYSPTQIRRLLTPEQYKLLLTLAEANRCSPLEALSGFFQLFCTQTQPSEDKIREYRFYTPPTLNHAFRFPPLFKQETVFFNKIGRSFFGHACIRAGRERLDLAVYCPGDKVHVAIGWGSYQQLLRDRVGRLATLSMRAASAITLIGQTRNGNKSDGRPINFFWAPAVPALLNAQGVEPAAVADWLVALDAVARAWSVPNRVPTLPSNFWLPAKPVTIDLAGTGDNIILTTDYGWFSREQTTVTLRVPRAALDAPASTD